MDKEISGIPSNSTSTTASMLQKLQINVEVEVKVAVGVDVEVEALLGNLYSDKQHGGLSGRRMNRGPRPVPTGTPPPPLKGSHLPNTKF